MVLIVHGFPNMISALRFEWAWTKPDVSRRLRHVAVKQRSEKRFDYKVRVMCEMLRTGPWSRLPLTVRWLKQNYQVSFDPCRLPPVHMPVEYGPVTSVKVKANPGSTQLTDRPTDRLTGRPTDRLTDRPTDRLSAHMDTVKQTNCKLCHIRLQENSNTVQCLNCDEIFHTLCLSSHFLSTCQSNSTCQSSSTPLLPVGGVCPGCGADVLWGDLIRYKHGCYHNLKQISAEESIALNEEHEDCDDEEDDDDHSYYDDDDNDDAGALTD